jgi:2-polyprenyl-3-methyl-5-hydroxy-6-metoxy-1,4-benzoquinol methylase
VTGVRDTGREEDDRRRWDERYATSEDHVYGTEPSALVVEHRALYPEGGLALDIAAGEGKNAVYLAREGFAVEAIDISAVGLAKARRLAEQHGVTIRTRLWDVKQSHLPDGPFDLVLCMHYLQRDLAPRITACLAPGGVLVMELNTIENLKLHRRPSRRYLLGPNELITWFPELVMLSYREGIFEGHGVAQLVARKRP